MQLKLKNKLAKQEVKAALATEPTESAEIVGLLYVNDKTPGVSRQRRGRGFCYYDTQGNKIDCEDELNRIKAIVIPPAWKEVWICPHPQGHLQATGRDEKRRKQYRYHKLWRKIRSQTKFNRTIAFGLALPKIRQQVEKDLRKHGLPKEKVLATVVKLLETSKIRVGNQQYAQRNKSFGLTTMKQRHVDISGSRLRFKFRGKSGVEHDIELSHRRLSKIVKRIQELPGQELFQFIDDDDKRQSIDSSDVNDYLKTITDLDFTAKDFRTWFGTVLTAQELYELGKFESEKQAKKNITKAIKGVARELGNRPATCRKYYVHPGILAAYEDSSLFPAIEAAYQSDKNQLESRPVEQAVLNILEQHLLQEFK
ncbi:DNA topoisomerase IB [Mastigocoleus testarum]|uniref:DNA topoisomerase n=1 Tax=Mastigocoleus testarum BC008 TaxID=371196 RepID=A0A0V7ZIG1_9CYAN|nr:DNA topoisomerase IB [Mastigocoleus testarum]KST63601.1 DNA topoisomerase I [Mastigocoleus testarum BC008]KST64175.1 DNA topoisomerase I [Mastigocoleus testarum BC008]